MLTESQLEYYRNKAKFYAEHPKETADLWRDYVIDSMNTGESCTGVVMDSIYRYKKKND